MGRGPIRGARRKLAAWSSDCPANAASAPSTSTAVGPIACIRRGAARQSCAGGAWRAGLAPANASSASNAALGAQRPSAPSTPPQLLRASLAAIIRGGPLCLPAKRMPRATPSGARPARQRRLSRRPPCRRKRWRRKSGRACRPRARGRRPRRNLGELQAPTKESAANSWPTAGQALAQRGKQTPSSPRRLPSRSRAPPGGTAETARRGRSAGLGSQPAAAAATARLPAERRARPGTRARRQRETRRGRTREEILARRARGRGWAGRGALAAAGGQRAVRARLIFWCARSHAPIIYL